MDRPNTKGIARLIDKRKRGDVSTFESMIDLGTATSASGDADSVPTCTIDGDDEADVFELYGLAGQPASGDALLFASEGDVDSLTALVSSPAGRPATEPGDVVLWSAAGHQVYLDNDGSITITSKDGAVITLDTNGNVKIEVGVGKSVLVGDDLAESLIKFTKFMQNMDDACDAAIATPPTPMAGNNGSLAFTNFKAAMALANASNPPDTTKAKGT